MGDTAMANAPRKQEEGQPLVVRSSLLWMQVCVPKDWTNKQVEEWVNKDSPTGITMPWVLTTQAHADEHGYELCAQCQAFGSHHHRLVVC